MEYDTRNIELKKGGSTYWENGKFVHKLEFLS